MRLLLFLCLGLATAGIPLAAAQTNQVPLPSAGPGGLRRGALAPGGATTPSAPPAVASAGGRSINFQGTPLQAVLQYYADLTKRSIIQAPNLAGVIYFTSQTNLSDEEAIQALESVLAINGIGLVPMGEKFLKVTQIATVKPEGLPVQVLGDDKAKTADSLVTQIIPLKYADAAEVAAALQPYSHAGYGQLMPLAKSNSILITDSGWTIHQMLEIVQYIDQPSALRMETRFYILKYAKAADVVQRLQSIVQDAQQLGARPGATPQPSPQVPQPMPATRFTPRPLTPGGGADAGDSLLEGKVVITPDERTNKIIILSRASNFDFFERMIGELDTKVEPDVQTKVVHLQYATAEEAALLINAVIGTSSGVSYQRTSGKGAVAGRAPSNTPFVPPSPVGLAGAGSTMEVTGFLQFAQGVRILPDPRTNTLLLMGTREDLARLETIIMDIDTPVAQVLVEVVIAEISLDGNLEVGVNLLKRVSGNADVRTFGGTATATDSSGNVVPGPVNLFATPMGATPPGAAISSALTYFATFRGLKLDAAIRLLSADSRFKVLSTPIIQTLDNQEASIIVGESRPVPTSTLSDVYGGSAVGTNQVSQGLRANVEYKDIAIELKVTPRINPDGYVTMDIDQKVNDLGGNVNIGGIEAPAITKREAKAFVTAKDQSTIVLGGLIKESKEMSETKVPFLGDVPFFGTLFKTKKTVKSRKELIVFIRPTVLRNSDQAQAEARRRAQMLQGGMELELERQFKSPSPHTNNVPAPAVDATNEVPVTVSTNAPAPTASSEEQQRHAAKVKALNEQKSTVD